MNKVAQDTTQALSRAAGALRLSRHRLGVAIWLGCLLSAAGSWTVYRLTNGSTQSEFQRAADDRIQAIQQEITQDLGTLRILGAYLERSKNDGQASFDRFAQQTFSAYRDGVSLQWAPRIRADERAAFETRLRAASANFSGIVSGKLTAGLTPVPAKSEYYPIQYIYPWDGAAPYAGYDVAASPATASAALRAIATGDASSTGILRLMDRNSQGFGITTFLAVYDAPDKGRIPAWRLQHCRGLAISVVQLGILVDYAMRRFNERGIATYVFDLSGTPDLRLLAVQKSAGASGITSKPASPQALRNAKLLSTRTLRVGGRNWEIDCVGAEFVSDGSLWQSILFLLCGLAVTCGVSLYIRTISRYTTDLATANLDLQRQVEDRHKAQTELAYQAHHDSLTGLPNRRQFSRRFDEAVERARQNGENLALLFVDLDGFKIINDTLGHAVGDTVLKTVATRFSNCISSRDVVARTGGDEFNFLLVGNVSSSLSERIAQGLLDCLNAPVEVSDRSLSLAASIGISIFPTHGQDFQELSHCADAAMYFAKKRGKNRFHRYTPELAVSTRRGMELALSLRGAIERNELCLFFQPIIGLGSPPTLRFEALLRWRHPQIGLLGPGHFFALAEETGLTAPIGNWVLRESCRSASQWQSVAKRPVGVSVNVSGLQFSRPDFIESVASALKMNHMPSSLLELEMSESSIATDIEESVVRLAALRRLGVSIAIDDFGIGYSALSHLETLPVNAIKISRSFLPQNETNYRRSSLLRSVIALGRSMSLRVAVGGIEISRQFELVRTMGPNEVQGFLFSKPICGTAVPAFIESWNQKQGSPEIERILEAARPPADLIVVRSRSQAV